MVGYESNLNIKRLLPWYCKNKKMAYCSKLLGIAFVD
jgi:hypothetical protein